MTANELADKCNRLQGEIILGFLADCATMLRQQQAECIDKDSRILDMQYKIKDLEYQVKMLNDLLQLKKAWRDFDVDGRC
jgi:hypothetical protein